MEVTRYSFCFAGVNLTAKTKNINKVTITTIIEMRNRPCYNEVGTFQDKLEKAPTRRIILEGPASLYSTITVICDRKVFFPRMRIPECYHVIWLSKKQPALDLLRCVVGTRYGCRGWQASSLLRNPLIPRVDARPSVIFRVNLVPDYPSLSKQCRTERRLELLGKHYCVRMGGDNRLPKKGWNRAKAKPPAAVV